MARRLQNRNFMVGRCGEESHKLVHGDQGLEQGEVSYKKDKTIHTPRNRPQGPPP